MFDATLDDLLLKRDKLNRFFPAVERLEDRLTPSGTTKTWMYSGTSPGEWNVGSNWSGSTVPTAADTVVFDGSAGTGTGDCNWGDAGGVAPHSISFLNTFNGTLNLFADEEISGDVNLDGGYLYQAASKTLTVDGNFEWSVDTLNTDNQQANLLLNGGGTITGGARTTRDNLNVTSTATLNMSGALTFENNASLTIQNGGRWNWNSATNLLTSGSGYVANYGMFIATIGLNNTAECQLPIVNGASTSLLEVVSGTLNSTHALAGVSVNQSNGSTIIDYNAVLGATSGYTMSGGNLITYGSGFGYIRGDVTITGGEIDLNYNHSGLSSCGDLSITGNLTMNGGTFYAKLDTSTNRGSTDQIAVSGNITLGNGATLTVINLTGSSGRVASGYTFTILYTTGTNTSISGDFGTRDLDFNDGSSGQWTRLVRNSGGNASYILSD